MNTTSSHETDPSSGLSKWQILNIISSAIMLCIFIGYLAYYVPRFIRSSKQEGIRIRKEYEMGLLKEEEEKALNGLKEYHGFGVPSM